MGEIRKAYKGVNDVLSRYWAIYGGRAALLRSPYFHFSVALTAVTFNSWFYEKWWLTVISVLPNLLGFTLGGFAIFLGFGDEKFKQIISGTSATESRDFSPYLSVSATFLHFVVVQVTALLWALVASALNFDLPGKDLSLIGRWLGLVGSAVGYWLFFYSIFLAIAAAIAIFRVAGWYDRFQSGNRP